MARTTSSKVALPGASTCSVPGRPTVLSLIVTVRPEQWTKNLLVFAGLLFARRLFDPAAVAEASLAFVIFCALSGSVYVINDLLDRDSDREHPLKARRPIDRRKSVRNRRVVDIDLSCTDRGDGERGVLLLISTAKCNRVLLMWFGYELDRTFTFRRAFSQHNFDLLFLRS